MFESQIWHAQKHSQNTCHLNRNTFAGFFFHSLIKHVVWPYRNKNENSNSPGKSQSTHQNDNGLCFQMKIPLTIGTFESLIWCGSQKREREMETSRSHFILGRVGENVDKVIVTKTTICHQLKWANQPMMIFKIVNKMIFYKYIVPGFFSSLEFSSSFTKAQSNRRKEKNFFQEKSLKQRKNSNLSIFNFWSHFITS